MTRICISIDPETMAALAFADQRASARSDAWEWLPEEHIADIVIAAIEAAEETEVLR